MDLFEINSSGTREIGITNPSGNLMLLATFGTGWLSLSRSWNSTQVGLRDDGRLAGSSTDRLHLFIANRQHVTLAAAS
jgi:hypothetical protein